MRFFCGLHHPSDAKHFQAAFLSVNVLRNRKAFAVAEWIMDSGAFSELSRYGKYRHSPAQYAAEIRRWSQTGRLLAAVGQDYMCEPKILARTGLSVRVHQELTIRRYDDLLAEQVGVYILPVVQGYHPDDYVRHLEMYGDRLAPGAWIGVGSLCKRNAQPRTIEAILLAIHAARPDLALHGFGIKATALRSALVVKLLCSADSMAWSYAARREGRNPHDWREAQRWVQRIERLTTAHE